MRRISLLFLGNLPAVAKFNSCHQVLGCCSEDEWPLLFDVTKNMAK